MRALHWRQWRSLSALTNWAHSSAMSRVSNDSRISFVGGAARPAAVADALSRMSLVCMCAAAPDNHYRVHQNTCRKKLQQQWCLSVLVQGFEPEGKRITHLISICRRFGLWGDSWMAVMYLSGTACADSHQCICVSTGRRWLTHSLARQCTCERKIHMCISYYRALEQGTTPE